MSTRKQILPTEKVFKCHICGHMFLRGCGLASHVRKHESEANPEEMMVSNQTLNTARNVHIESETEDTDDSRPTSNGSAHSIRKSERDRKKVKFGDYYDEEGENPMLGFPPKKIRKTSARSFLHARKSNQRSDLKKAPELPNLSGIKKRAYKKKDLQVFEIPDEINLDIPLQEENNLEPSPSSQSTSDERLPFPRSPPKYEDFTHFYHLGFLQERHQDEVEALLRRATDEYEMSKAVNFSKNADELKKANNRPMAYFMQEYEFEKSRECPDCSYKNYYDLEEFKRHRDKHYRAHLHKCTECNFSYFNPHIVRKHTFEDHFLQDVKYVEGISSSESEEEEEMEPVFVPPKKQKRRRRRNRY